MSVPVGLQRDLRLQEKRAAERRDAPKRKMREGRRLLNFVESDLAKRDSVVKMRRVLAAYGSRKYVDLGDGILLTAGGFRAGDCYGSRHHSLHVRHLRTDDAKCAIVRIDDRVAELAQDGIRHDVRDLGKPWGKDALLQGLGIAVAAVTSPIWAPILAVGYGYHYAKENL